VAEALRGGSAQRNARVFRALLDDPDDPAVAGIRDAVCLNAAAALVAFAAAGGHLPVEIPDPSADLTTRMAVALPAARAALTSGAARTLLDQWISTSQDLQP
jgi:anthranilate phosphoribosyltransferase